MEDLKLTMQNISICAEGPCSTVEQPIDCDITLPDYCTDIQKILKCMAVTGISSVAVSGNRIMAEGSVTVRVLYLDDNEEIGTYEQSVPFAKYVEESDLQSVVFTDCRAKTGYMNCRAVNQRRVDIHGAVILDFYTRVKRDTAVITGDLSEDLEKRSCNLKIANSAADAGRFFAVTEVENLKDRPAVGSIIRTGSYALVNEVKVIKDKALVKGDLLVTLTYTSKSSSSIERYDTRLPISQIVDAAGLDENEIIDTSLRVTQLNIIPKVDATGEYKLLDISARLVAEMHAYSECEFSGVTDAYSLKDAIVPEHADVPVLKYVEKIEDSILVNSNLDISESECSDVLDIWCCDSSTSYKFSESTLEIYGSATVGLIGKSADEGYNFFERTVDFSYTKTYESIESVHCMPKVLFTGQSAAKNSSGGFDVRLEASLKVDVFAQEKLKLVTDIKVSEGETIHSDEGAAVVIYFASQGESVWDIARRYNTTVVSVMTENELADDILQKDMMLLIPR